MATVLAAYPDRDLREDARCLVEVPGAVVEPVNSASSVHSPDLVTLCERASSHCNINQGGARYLHEGFRGKAQSPDRGLAIEAKHFIPTGRNSRESAFNLLKMLRGCRDDEQSPAD